MGARTLVLIGIVNWSDGETMWICYYGVMNFLDWKVARSNLSR